MFENLLEKSVAGCEWWRLASFFAVVLGSLVVGRVGGLLLARGSDRAGTAGRAALSILLRALSRSVILIALALGIGIVTTSRLLGLPEPAQGLLDVVARVLNAVAVGYVLYRLVDMVDVYLHRMAERTTSKVDDVLAPLVGKSIRITVTVLVVLNVATVVSGRNMATILAGLGVGGLAVALAAQDTIRNFIGSLVILGDKPFEIGDRVVVDGHDGPVEAVGFRSTKIRTLDGHLVTVPNAEIVGKTVRNIGKRPHIRRLANITITYDTPPEKVREAVSILLDILKDHEGMHPDFPPRVFFSDFNDCSLNILVLYWYHPPEYWKYMAFSEGVNHEILCRFNEAGIEFAFPTQTVFVANDDRRQMAVRMFGETTGS